MSRRSPTRIFVHIVWATARRRNTIALEHDAVLHDQLREAVRLVECEVIAVGNASDHVHVLVRLSPRVRLCDVVQRMKGRTSFFGPWRWQAGYFAESVATADLDATRAYVLDQRAHHDDSHPAELWIVRQLESAAGGLPG